ncbi:hydroxyisourate hydrolase [Phaeovulum vinaykumarii]|uniref:5-hydroxyisourate hydrolase n=1 Tax=Phaeovulum vinaykumarii TaxID=407234 RepID=A0A1N7JX28_9RHOB|nr:hydroxyisourate hydrolase [Phaeovulum vinaykumarii]SIS53905.1 5-hydroxyisourate hydrolase [Phaeovulum vinaykumarii]SOB91750.1 5-hydroxyisourate hydrolase [Phaeovulum vinaykumarii]
MSGWLSTHVLDTTRGRPAQGLLIELFRLDGGRRPLHSARTNADGRTDMAILPAGEFHTGIYELVFHAGPWFEHAGYMAEMRDFLDEIPIRFRVTDASAHYHVPLLLSPHGYSTYRGS